MTDAISDRCDPEVFCFTAPRLRDDPPQLVLSIQPRHARNILRGTKTVEFRRRFPDTDRMTGATIWMYSTSPVRAVVGLATVERVMRMPLRQLWSKYHGFGGVDQGTFDDYFSDLTHGCAIQLADVTRLDKEITAASLSERGFRAPQSYRYVTADVYPLLRRAFGEAASRHQHRDQA